MEQKVIMPWGKYAGDELGDVPNRYLDWLLGSMDPRTEKMKALYRAIEQEMRERDETGFYVPSD